MAAIKPAINPITEEGKSERVSHLCTNVAGICQADMAPNFVQKETLS